MAFSYRVLLASLARIDDMLITACARRDPVKGVAALIGSGTIESSPSAVAAFLREHISELDQTQLGEYFGHHDEQAVRL